MNRATASGATPGSILAACERLRRTAEPRNRRVLWYAVPPERLMAELAAAGVPRAETSPGRGGIEIRAGLGGTVCGTPEALRRLAEKDRPVDLRIAGTGTVIRLNYPLAPFERMPLRDPPWADSPGVAHLD